MQRTDSNMEQPLLPGEPSQRSAILINYGGQELNSSESSVHQANTTKTKTEGLEATFMKMVKKAEVKTKVDRQSPKMMH